MKRSYWITLYCLGWALPILLWLNWWMVSIVALRFTNPQLNLLTFLLSQVFGPLAILVAGLFIFKRWWRIAHTILASGMMALSGIIVLMTLFLLQQISVKGCNLSLCPVDTESLPHGNIVLYQTTGAKSKSQNGIKIRQEVNVLPGVNLVHEVAKYDHAYSATLGPLSAGRMYLTYMYDGYHGISFSRSIRLNIYPGWLFDRVEVK